MTLFALLILFPALSAATAFAGVVNGMNQFQPKSDADLFGINFDWAFM